MVKNLPANVGYVRDVGLIPGWGRSPGGAHGNPLQDFCLENPMDRRACQATVHGITRVGHDLGTKPPPPQFVRAKLTNLLNAAPYTCTFFFF